MGHLLFAWAPHFITVLMGSVFQVAVPVIVIIVFYRQPDYFGMSVGGIWLSYSLWELSEYVGDARSQDLPLVGFASAEDLEHDWHYLLGKLHMLPADHFLAFVLKVLSRHGSTIRVAAPPSGAVAPPGPYMLFVNRSDAKGLVPSVSRQVFVGLETFDR